MDKKNFVILLIGTIIAAFLGAFLASLFIFRINRPQHLAFVTQDTATSQIPGMETYMSLEDTDKTDKIIQDQQKFFDKVNKDFANFMKQSPITQGAIFVSNNKLNIENASFIKTEELKDVYKITIDLKSFNNDPQNIDLKVKGNTITISAKYKSKNKNELSSSQFYQTLTLPSKIDTNNIKQHKEDNSLVITIPKKGK